jgi:hypothetical protein
MIHSHAFRILVAALAAAALAGCNPGSGKNGESTMETVSGLPYEQTTKLSAYASTLASVDLPQKREDYAQLTLSDAKQGDTAYIDAATIVRAREDLQRDRALVGKLPEIDAAADRLIAALQKLETRVTGLDSYFTMRSYLEDGFARARAEDPLVLAEFDAVIAAMLPLRALIDQAETRNDAKVLPWLKSQGRMADYHDALIAQKARALRHATEDEGAIDDPARIAEADRIVASLPAMLDQARAAQREQAQKAKQAQASSDSPAAADVNEPSPHIITGAERMIGAYRDMRQSKKPEDRRDLKQAIDSVLMLAAN